MHGESRSEARMIAFTDPRFAAHAPLGFHPERPERLESAERGLARVTAPALRRLQGTPRDATRAELARVHGERHLDRLESVLLDRGAGFLDGDTYYGPHSRKAAWLAAGSGCALVEALLADEADVGVLLARPPGHHATRDRAMGFCLLNNVAVAAAHARTLGAQRVAVIDWDVHHGNGTQHIFAGRDDVLVFNTHQSPHYPGTGAVHEQGVGAGLGYTVNAPLPAGLGDGDYAAVFARLLRPVAASFRPDLVLVSAGFDAHRDDPLGDMQVSAEGFAGLCAVAREIAEDTAGGRLVLALEGGYDLAGLADSVHGCVEVLAGASPGRAPAASATGEAVLRMLLAEHGRRWKL